MPGIDEREQIWRVQMHPTLTPLAADVNFRALAERHEVSGGDIRNAVLKAAMAAASEPGREASKAIHQRHLEEGIQEVIGAKRVMRQSLFLSDSPMPPEGNPAESLDRFRLGPGFGNQCRRGAPLDLTAIAISR